jgi:hypothetical protein
MKNLMLGMGLLALLLPVSGCSLWFGDDDCDYGGPGFYDDGASDAIGFLNPYSGQCEWYGGGGGGTCGDDWGGAAEPDREALDWAQCWSACTGLDENSCQASSGCRAAYISDCPEGWDCGSTTYSFYECWATAPSGPIQGGGCEGLDAYDCSRHDDCSARHYGFFDCNGGTEGNADCAPQFDPSRVGNFESCVAESFQGDGCYSDNDCDPNESCNADELCLPDPNGCGGGGDGNGDSADPVPCEQACWGYCVPDDPGPSCYGDVFCDSIPPECPAGSVPGISNGCWSNTCIEYDQCAPPIDPGLCYAEVTCLVDFDSFQDPCPPDSVPGVIDGCWSGYCIPMADCEAPPECADVMNEPSCIARDDCTPTYQGVDCTCDPNGNCTCDDWVFDACTAS